MRTTWFFYPWCVYAKCQEFRRTSGFSRLVGYIGYTFANNSRIPRIRMCCFVIGWLSEILWLVILVVKTIFYHTECEYLADVGID